MSTDVLNMTTPKNRNILPSVKYASAEKQKYPTIQNIFSIDWKIQWTNKSLICLVTRQCTDTNWEKIEGHDVHGSKVPNNSCLRN